MRACCVFGCKSSGKMPSHQFPKNASRRINWLERLRLTERDQNIIDKLRVCYKHFKDSDYSCSINRRRLIDIPVPSINIGMCEDQTKTIQQQQKTIEMPQQQETVDISQPEENTIVTHQEQEKNTSNTDAQVKNMITDHEILMQHDQSIQTFKQELIKQQLKMQEIENQVIRKTIKQHLRSPYTRRPHLAQITRKRKLSPIAKKFYDSTIKLHKETRRLKKVVLNLKKNIKSKTIIINTTDHKGRKDETAVVRQRFMDMIVKNDKIAPQVKFQPASYM